jgi:alanyl-tRNA synthetase
METKRLFEIDPYLDHCTGRVLACTPVKEGYELLLDQTCFYPEGGGQPSDTGTLGGQPVLDVQERAGEIIHLCTASFEVGQALDCQVDWPRRFDFMQQHSGEHIVSGLVHGKYGYDNVGFHMGSELVTIDFNGMLTERDLEEIELLANEAVWKNLPVICTYPEPEALKSIPYRSKKIIQGPVRIVEIPGYDSCACCGTHVAHTGEIGVIKLISCQKFRSGVRVEMLCGRRALLYLQGLARANHSVSVQLSAKPMEIAQAVERLNRETGELRYALVGWENRYCAETAQRYVGAGDLLFFVPEFSPDGVRKLAAAVTEACGGLCAVFSGDEDAGYRYALGWSGVEIKSFVHEMNQNLQGRGGGKGSFAQGSVQARREEIENFFAGKISGGSVDL